MYIMYGKKRTGVKSGKTYKYGPRRKVLKRVYNKSSAITVAKKALKLASQVANGSTETKYLGYSTQSDVVNNGSGSFGAAIFRELTTTASTSELFDSGGLRGNKSFLKYVKGTWEIHMDNTNNEEETCNFTVAVWKIKQDADYDITSAGNLTSTVQGQTYFDPRKIKLLYYKHFTLTMGGVQPGAVGPATKYGNFFIPVNKMIRFVVQNQSGELTSDNPASYQDRIYFTVHTDNTSADTENPRINYRTISCWRDSDTN